MILQIEMNNLSDDDFNSFGWLIDNCDDGLDFWGIIAEQNEINNTITIQYPKNLILERVIKIVDEYMESEHYCDSDCDELKYGLTGDDCNDSFVTDVIQYMINGGNIRKFMIDRGLFTIGDEK